MFHKREEKKLAEILPDESEGSSRVIRRVVKIGCAVNLMLMAMKLLTGWLGHSDALVADGFHSLNDVAADIIMLVFVGLSYKSADSKYPYGYGKFETFSSFLVSAFLIAVGVMIAWEGVETIVEYANGMELQQPDIWTVVVVIVAMLCKEGLYRFYSLTGKRQNCRALIANAWHHRSDALASVATLAGVGAAHFLGAGFRILDPVVSVFLAIVIIVSAIKLFRPAFSELMETSLPKEDVEKAGKAIESASGVEGIDFLHTRRNGHHLIFDVGVSVAPMLTVNQSAEVVENVRLALEKAFCRHVITTVSISPQK